VKSGVGGRAIRWAEPNVGSGVQPPLVNVVSHGAGDSAANASQVPGAEVHRDLMGEVLMDQEISTSAEIGTKLRGHHEGTRASACWCRSPHKLRTDNTRAGAVVEHHRRPVKKIGMRGCPVIDVLDQTVVSVFSVSA